MDIIQTDTIIGSHYITKVFECESTGKTFSENWHKVNGEWVRYD